VTLGRHGLDLLALVALLLGPLPLCLVLCDEPQHRRPASHALLCLLVAWCTLQMALGLLLGWLGWLRLEGALAAEALLLFVGGSLAIRRRPDMSVFVPAQRPSVAEWIVVASVLTLGTSLLLQLAMHPITDDDSLGYHLTLMARWYQAGTLVRLERHNEVFYYPFGWETLCTLFLLPFREDFLVTLPNILAWAIMGLGVQRVGVQAGASRLHALAGAFCILAIPLVSRQVPTMHVDLALAAFFIAGVCFILAYGRSRSRVDLALAVAALGLVAGIKISGLVYGALLAGAFVLARRHTTGTDSRWAPLALVPPAMLVAVFWYARNLAEIGNPVGLVHVEVLGHTLFSGPLEPAMLARTTLANLFDVRRAEDWRVIGTVVGGWLRLPFLLLVAATLALLRRSRPLGQDGLVVVLLLLASVWAYAVTPYSGVIAPTRTRITPWMAENLRFALPFLPLLGATASVGATRVAGPVVVLLGVIAVLAGTTNPAMPAAAGLMLLVGAVATLRPRPLVAAALVGCFATILVCASFWLRTHRDAERQRLYAPVLQVVARELRHGGTVAHITPALGYLLYGTNMTNDVALMPATSHDRNTWIAALRTRHIVLIAAGPVHPEELRGPEFAWLADPAGPFERIAGESPSSETVLYRLPERGPTPPPPP
jgi:hypothetical protein